MISALGFDTETHWKAMLNGATGIKRHEDFSLLNQAFCAALISKEAFQEELSPYRFPHKLTRLEKMFALSIQKAANEAQTDLKSEKTGFIFSTTKGNIDLLSNPQGFNRDRLRLGKMAEAVTHCFQNPNRPTVISNACISGVMAIIVACRMLRAGHLETMVVTGGDLVTPFTLSGFNALKALSDDYCKPFDAARKGINLGEGVGTVILSMQKEKGAISIGWGGVSNDANHISGPSRTGEGLQLAIKSALNAGVAVDKIDYISAHGTATLYNDEMEAKAFHALNLEKVPMNSFKGYWGHTLGAAGVLESIIAYNCLKNNQLLPSFGFKNMGVTMPLNVIRANKTTDLQTVLKTSSGFGGCNAAVIFQKK